VSWGNSGYGGDQRRTADFLQSGISSVFSNKNSFLAIKDSDLAKPPAGCVVWQYSSRAALIFSATANGGVCGEEFKCLCASCNTTFEGEISSLAPGNYSLLISTAEEEAGGVHCQEQALREFSCNSNEGYERVWDNERKQDYCRLSLSHICQTAKVMVEGNELKGSPMVAHIRETTALTVRLLASNSAKVELRPVQPVSAAAEVDGKGLSSFALSTTGEFELHFVHGESSCKLPSDLKIRCDAGYDNRDASCVQQANDTTDLNVVLGGLVGAVAAACVGLLLFYLRKHPQQAMKACRPSAARSHI
jgi:hypothetical protein